MTDAQPLELYQLFLLLLALLMLIAHLSFSAGKYVKHHWPQIKPEASDFIPSTILGLVALILAFTFSMAIGRFDRRLELVVQESNAIGTTYLRSKLMEPAQRGQEVRDLLKQYVDARLEFFEVGTNAELIEKAEAKARHIQDQLWNLTVQFTQKDRGAVAAQFVSSLNEVIDLQSQRAAALRNTIPKIVYVIMLLITSAGIGSLAFARGAHSESSRWSISLLVCLFVGVFTLIRDLDRPRAGTITISQEPMRELKRSLQSDH
ncbi:MAG: DUF4239 domain-containing protein [Bdellovibrionales bacterium]|nr:DUF4239 domain-containing protein [Bdellovibrionales bacterium]